jgi:hypothetical protein
MTNAIEVQGVLREDGTLVLDENPIYRRGG